MRGTGTEELCVCTLLHCVLPLLRVYEQLKGLKMYVICTHDTENIILWYPQKEKNQ